MKKRAVVLTLLSTFSQDLYKGNIMAAIEEFHKHTCIKFKVRTTERNWIKFSKDKGWVKCISATKSPWPSKRGFRHFGNGRGRGPLVRAASGSNPVQTAGARFSKVPKSFLARKAICEMKFDDLNPLRS